MMQNCPSEETLRGFLQGALSENEAEDVNAHLESCSECQSNLNKIGDESVQYDVNTAQRVLLDKQSVPPQDLPVDHPDFYLQATHIKELSLSDDERDQAIPPPSGFGSWIDFPDGDMLKKGGMGVIRVADSDPHFKRPVVVKFLQTALFTGSNQREAVERFQREASIQASLQHLGVPPAHAQGVYAEPDGLPWFAMKLVQGETLADEMRRIRPPHNLTRRIEIILAVADAMAAAHKKGIIHRDLKPGNIMIGADSGEVQVMDWGIAKILGEAPTAQDLELRRMLVSREHADDDESVSTSAASLQETPTGTHELTLQGQILGTYPYMPPELANGEVSDLTPAADVFAIGAMLCEIVTGKPIYRATQLLALRLQATNRKLNDVLRDLAAAKVAGVIDQEFLTICVKCLNTEPEDRYSNANELSEAIRDYQQSAQERLRIQGMETASERTRSQERRKRRRLISLVLLATVVMAGLFGWSKFEEQQVQMAGEQTLEQRLDDLLTPIEQETTKMLEQQKSRVEWYQLKAQPADWDRRLSEMDSGISTARNLQETAGFEVDSRVQDRFQHLAGLVEHLERDRELAQEVFDLSLDGSFRVADLQLRTNDTFTSGYVSDSLSLYQGVFSKLFDSNQEQELRQLENEAIVEAVQRTTVPWLWVDFFDGYLLVRISIEADAEDELREQISTLSHQLSGNSTEDVKLANSVREFVKLQPSDSQRLHEYAKHPEVGNLSYEVLALLVFELNRRGQSEIALNLYEEVAHLHPQDFRILTGLGAISEDLNDAESALVAARAIFPEHYYVNSALGQIYLLQGVESLGQIEGQLSKPEFAALNQKLHRADEHFVTSLKTIPKRQSAVIFYSLGIQRETMAEILQRQYADTLWGQLSMTSTDKQSVKQSIEDAVKFYADAVKVDETFSPAWNNLASIHFEREEWEKARGAYEKATEVNPGRLFSWVNLGNIYMKSDQLDQAEECYQKAIAINPDHPNAWACWGNVKMEIQDYPEAKRLFQEALKRYPDDHPQGRYCTQQLEKIKRIQR